MVLWALAVSSLVLAALPLGLFLVNLRAYRRPAPVHAAPAEISRRGVSVLIPARDEEANIQKAVDSVLANREPDLEVLVMDDHSEDTTAAIVEQLARKDPRVRLLQAPELPPGWCGKMHACLSLARQARFPLLLFMDADVRLSHDAMSRLAKFLQDSGASWASGFPRQITKTFLERTVLPLMHFVALGFLPIPLMRRSRHPAFGAGCGQLYMTTREAYEHVGGHAVIRTSRHDGLSLARAYRRAGLRTDLFDATEVAACRMYHSAGEVVQGLVKNATEGLAQPAGIVPWTLLLGGGQVLPAFLLLVGGGSLWMGVESDVSWIPAAGLACLCSWLPRLIAAFRFRQSWLGAVLHPLGVSVLLALQWYALARHLAGRPATWKGRSYSSGQ